jgi:hypothetical protein
VPRVRKPGHVPTQKTKNIVKKHAVVGTPQEIIASILGIDPKTLRKHYRDHLDHALAIANGEIGGVLYRNAMKGNIPALIFWAKTRAGFREARADGDDSGSPQAITINIVKPNVDS